MDRPTNYSQQIIRLFDIMHLQRDVLKGFSRLCEDLFGGTNTLLFGLEGTEKSIPSLTINIAKGRIYQLRDTDETDWGALSADSYQILQQGHTEALEVTLNTDGLSPGESKWALIEAKFLQASEIRSGDPTNGVLAYWNAADPTTPLQGPLGSGGQQNTLRRGGISIQVSYGAPATTGSEAPPPVSSGFAPLYLINLQQGQTTITTGQILKAGPSIAATVPGSYPVAPFAGGLYSSHHKGLGGQAPKIILTEEVQGILPFANLPVSNTDPPGGSFLSVVGLVAGDPNGSRAGGLGDSVFDILSGVIYYCTTAGVASGVGAAVWDPVGASPFVSIETGDLNIALPTFGTYLMEPASADATVDLAAVASMGDSKITIKNNLPPGGSYNVIIDPNASETIDGQSQITLLPGNAVTIVPEAGGWSVTEGRVSSFLKSRNITETIRTLPTSGSISGIYVMKDVVWSSTGNITIDGPTYVFMNGGSFTLNSGHTITGTALSNGGVSTAQNYSRGGDGGGLGGGQGAGQNAGGSGAGGPGSSTGGYGGIYSSGYQPPPGRGYSYLQDICGSGGGAGCPSASVAGGLGGGGGEGFYVEAFNCPIVVSENISCSGGAGQDIASSFVGCGGGGSGGSIIFRGGGTTSFTLSSGKSLSCNGGRGGNATSSAGPGGGGAGGRVEVTIESSGLTNAGSISVTGGAAGTGGGGSTAGSAGQSVVAASTKPVSIF